MPVKIVIIYAFKFCVVYGVNFLRHFHHHSWINYGVYNILERYL